VSTKDEEWDILEKKSLGTIRMCLEASMDFNIPKENTMEDMMNALDKLYEKPLTSNEVFPMKRLFNMKMLEDGFISYNLN
jgi:hypothetical protein